MGGGLISFLALPLITRRLGPVAFGTVALVTAFVSLGNALATLGSSFVIYRFVPDQDQGDGAVTVSSLCAVAAIASVTWAAVVAGLFVTGVSFAGLDRVPPEAVLMSLGTMLLSPYWSITTDILILEGRSGVFSAATLLQTLTGVVTTLVALFWFDLGVLALFAGNLAAMLVLGSVAVVTLHPYRARPDRASMRRVVAVARHNLAPQAAESGFVFAERLLVSRFAGLGALGLYSHSQRYREIAQLGIKSIARGIWPVSLAEARDPAATFAFTGAAWSGMYVLLTAAGIGAAAVGDHVISWITNGRFTESYLLVAGWVAYVLIQSSARPQLATLFALGDPEVVARVNLKANLTGLALLGVGVPLLGPAGGLVAGIAGIAVSRTGFTLASRRYRATPVQDRWVLGGLLLIGATMMAKVVFDPDFGGSLLLLAGAEAVCIACGVVPLARLLRAIARRPSA